MKKAGILFIVFYMACFIFTGCAVDKSNGGGIASYDKCLVSEKQDDVCIIKERILSNLWNETPNYYYELEEYRKLLSNGIFSNVDYESHDAAAWDTEKHLCYLKDMTLQYGKRQLESDGEIRDRIIEGLRYWCDARFNCEENWWFNVIKVPRDLLELGLLMEPYLPQDLSEGIREITKGRTALMGDLTWYQGANLSDILNNSVMYAVLMDDAGLIDRNKEILEADLAVRVSLEETGIQKDMSFTTSHGGLSCGGSYGGAYCLYMSRLVALLWGTKYSVNKENIKLLVDHILEGENYFHMKLGTAYFSDERHAVDADDADLVRDSVKILAGLDGIYRQSDLEEYYMSFVDTDYVNAVLKIFPDVCCLINKNKDFYIGVKGANEGFVSTQVQNGQGVLNYNLSYGSNTCYMHDGTEYSTIGAVMDFSMWPGITTYHESDEEIYLRYEKEYGTSWGWGDYTKSEGRWCRIACSETSGKGVLTMNLLQDNITGQLSFFVFENGLIALGTDLNCSKANNYKEIRTSVNQCKAVNPITINGELLQDEIIIRPGEKVINDGFAYYNLGKNDMRADSRLMTGSKSRGDSAGSGEEVSVQVFQCWYSYGNTLLNEDYAYAVIDVEQENENYWWLDISITNTTDVQAVEFKDGHYAAVLHTSGEFTLTGGTVVSGISGSIIIY